MTKKELYKRLMMYQQNFDGQEMFTKAIEDNPTQADYKWFGEVFKLFASDHRIRVNLIELGILIPSFYTLGYILKKLYSEEIK